MCCGHKRMLASFLGLRVNWGTRRNYLPKNLHEVDAKERKKKNERTNEKEGRRGNRDA